MLGRQLRQLRGKARLTLEWVVELVTIIRESQVVLAAAPGSRPLIM